MERPSLGTIMAGSLQDGLLVQLTQATPLEVVKTGKFVTVYGAQYRFFSLITDLRLTTSHQESITHPPLPHERLLTEFLRQHTMHAVATIRPLVLLDANNRVLPVTTIPPHFAPVFATEAAEFAAIFGSESDPTQRAFAIGSPLDMAIPVCINLDRLSERSIGIFGKTGTGKTFITRLLIAGIIGRQSGVCVIFDMHSEYAYQARNEGNSTFVKGLKTLFPHRVALFSLDPVATRRRGLSPDGAIELTYEMIHVEDLLSLQEELNLHPTACEAAYLLAASYKDRWLTELLAQGASLKELAQKVGAHPESIAALYRKIRQIERLPFVRPATDRSRPVQRFVEEMIDYIDRGISIIIEFGSYTSTFCYLFIANIITRHLHTLYTRKTEQFLGSQQAHRAPPQLIIVIEEAHKFLNPVAARQTTFGTIAREMRKYYVSLLIVDQRPSGIDPEVLSQIGTKCIAQLSDERDIGAVLAGAPQSSYLRMLISSLASRQQMVTWGHALTIPILLETRAYDERFYRDILTLSPSPTSTAPSWDDLYPDQPTIS